MKCPRRQRASVEPVWSGQLKKWTWMVKLQEYRRGKWRYVGRGYIANSRGAAKNSATRLLNKPSAFVVEEE